MTSSRRRRRCRIVISSSSSSSRRRRFMVFRSEARFVERTLYYIVGSYIPLISSSFPILGICDLLTPVVEIGLIRITIAIGLGFVNSPFIFDAESAALCVLCRAEAFSGDLDWLFHKNLFFGKIS